MRFKGNDLSYGDVGKLISLMFYIWSIKDVEVLSVSLNKTFPSIL